MRALHPQRAPHDVGMLDVGDGHRLSYTCSGNPNGRPAVVLHGGPGGASNPRQRRFFDPSAYQIIQFDQRGCGSSTPHASLEHNTTWHLVADLERLRVHLGVERWLVFGGSWGSTLALAYAQSHPDRVRAMVLRGLFLLRASELRWFYQEGASGLFPEAWAAFVGLIPAEERDDLLRAYHRRLTSDDAAVRLEAARAWTIWETRTSSLRLNADAIQRASDAEFATAFARIEAHYFVHGGFFETDDALLRGLPRIRHIPTTLVQGRYDVVCPMTTAWTLKRHWPEVRLEIVDNAGHSSFEPGIVQQLVDATDRFR
ncbi:MAG: prolyl aminopeptidase [Myxococcota bacterium]